MSSFYECNGCNQQLPQGQGEPPNDPCPCIPPAPTCLCTKPWKMTAQYTLVPVTKRCPQKYYDPESRCSKCCNGPRCKNKLYIRSPGLLYLYNKQIIGASEASLIDSTSAKDIKKITKIFAKYVCCLTPTYAGLEEYMKAIADLYYSTIIAYAKNTDTAIRISILQQALFAAKVQIGYLPICPDNNSDAICCYKDFKTRIKHFIDDLNGVQSTDSDSSSSTIKCKQHTACLSSVSTSSYCPF